MGGGKENLGFGAHTRRFLRGRAGLQDEERCCHGPQNRGFGGGGGYF